MGYLIDTDVISEHLAGSEDMTFFLEALADEGLAISIVTYMEAYEGAYYGSNPRLFQERFAKLADAIEVVPFSKAAARRCARLRAALRKRGSRVRGHALDIVNAAIAIENRLTLVSRNVDDYQDIPGLKLYLGQGAERTGKKR